MVSDDKVPLAVVPLSYQRQLSVWSCQVGALRKVVVFRTLAQDQLESLANALEVESWRWEVEGGKEVVE